MSQEWKGTPFDEHGYDAIKKQAEADADKELREALEMILAPIIAALDRQTAAIRELIAVIGRKA